MVELPKTQLTKKDVEMAFGDALLSLERAKYFSERIRKQSERASEALGTYLRQTEGLPFEEVRGFFCAMQDLVKDTCDAISLPRSKAGVDKVCYETTRNASRIINAHRKLFVDEKPDLYELYEPRPGWQIFAIFGRRSGGEIFCFEALVEWLQVVDMEKDPEQRGVFLKWLKRQKSVYVTQMNSFSSTLKEARNDAMKATEREISKAIVAQLEVHRQASELTYYVNLEGARRDARQQVAIKREGARPGRPDIEVFLPGGRVILIEIKRKPGGRVSQYQSAEIEALQKLGHEVHILWAETPLHGIEQLKTLIG